MIYFVLQIGVLTIAQPYANNNT